MSRYPYNSTCLSYSDLRFLRTVHIMGGSPGDVGEVPVTYVKQRKDFRMSCVVGEATEGLKNEL